VRQAIVETVHPFGTTVEITTDDERFVAAAHHAMSRYPASAATRGTFVIRATSLSDAPADPAWPITEMRERDGLVRLTCGSGRMLVDLNSGRGEVRLPQSLIAIEDAARLFIEGAMWTWLIGTGRVRAVHAGMVGDDRRTALLRGASGAGKSTITYACMRAGMRIASDDWVYSATTRSSTELYGYPWRLFLVADAATRFDELRGRELVAHPGSDRWKLPVIPSPEQQLLSTDPDVVVFLDPASELSLRSVGKAEARQRFWSSALPSERERLGRRWIHRLLDKPCYVLQRGTNPDAAAALVATLLGDAGWPERCGVRLDDVSLTDGAPAPLGSG
jgi:hypothetical protein